MNYRTLLIAALLAAGTIQDARTLQPGGAAASAQESTQRVLTEDQVGLSFFRPRHERARNLVRYAAELTESQLYVATSMGVVKHRDRFVLVGDSIGVQGDEAGRSAGLSFLKELDEYIGQTQAEAPVALDTLVRTVRLRSLSVGSAMQLLDTMAQTVERHVVVESATIILRGPTADVARAETLLLEVDRPTPQMSLTVTLLEASDDTTKPVAQGELGQALGALMPGKSFREAGRFVVRGGVSGSAPLELSTGFGAGAVQSKFFLRAASRSWDAERGVLTLGQCEVQSERPRFSTDVLAVVNGKAETQEVVAGFDKEGLTTDLTLKQDQDTVVGALGSTTLLVVLRFHVDPQ